MYRQRTARTGERCVRSRERERTLETFQHAG